MTLGGFGQRANFVARDRIIDNQDAAIVVHRVKYLNNIVDQDHRAIKRQPRPMPGFNSFHAAKRILADIELMHMIKKGLMQIAGGKTMSCAEQFYVLAGDIRPA